MMRFASLGLGLCRQAYFWNVGMLVAQNIPEWMVLTLLSKTAFSPERKLNISVIRHDQSS